MANKILQLNNFKQVLNSVFKKKHVKLLIVWVAGQPQINISVFM